MTVVVRTDRRIVAVPAPPAGSSGAPGAKGDPGGNIMAVGLFTAASGLTIPVGTNLVKTSGYLSDGKGSAEYVYDAAVDAAYVTANPRTSFRDAAGRGFRLSTTQPFLNWHMFGCHADDASGTGTDDYAAFTAALAWLRAQRLTGSAVVQYGTGKSQPIWCFGAAYFSAKVITDWAADIRGFGSGIPGGAATQIRWPDNTGGFLFDTNSDGWNIERMTLVGGWTNGDESESHAIEWNAKGCRRDLFISNWGGDGLYADNQVASGTGNSNGDETTRVFVQGCRRALVQMGADTNGCEHRGIVAVGNRQCGIWESGSIGSKYTYELEANARTAWNTGLAARPCSYVHSSGHLYACVVGQETWCSTHGPTGTTASNQGWAYWTDGAAQQGIPTWFSGINVRAGGGVIHQGLSSQSRFEGYVEADECCQLDQKALVINPVGADVSAYFAVFNGTLQSGRPAMVRAHNGGGLAVPSNLEVWGSFVHFWNGEWRIDGSFNPITGGSAANDILLTYKTGNTSITHSYKKADGTQFATFQAIQSAGFIWDTSVAGGAHFFNIGGTTVADIESAGLNLATGKVLKIAGTTVLSGKMSHIANLTAAPTAADFNGLLAALQGASLMA